MLCAGAGGGNGQRRRLCHGRCKMHPPGSGIMTVLLLLLLSGSDLTQMPVSDHRQRTTATTRRLPYVHSKSPWDLGASLQVAVHVFVSDQNPLPPQRHIIAMSITPPFRRAPETLAFSAGAPGLCCPHTTAGQRQDRMEAAEAEKTAGGRPGCLRHPLTCK